VLDDPFDYFDRQERPTQVRYWVVAFLAAMTFVLYLDRACIGQAAPMMKKELGISDSWMGWVFTAFTLSYALFEIPTGRWGDRYGSRGVLTRIVIWWSCFTALTGAATGLAMLLAVRFLFGAGEAGALPNSARVLREWFPEANRGKAQGVITTAMLVGGAVAPRASQTLIDVFHWRWTFAVFGLVGVVWAAAFYLWFRDDPAEHKGTNAAERLLISSPGKDLRSHEPIPWHLVLGNANVWLLGGTMITMSAIYFMMMYWYPTYLQEARGVSPGSSSWLTTMVLGTGAVGCLLGGWLTDHLVETTAGRRWGRTGQSVVGASLAAAGILASLYIDNTLLASVCFALACFGVQLQVPAWWASATLVSGKHVGALFGLMNMIGAAGAASSQVFLGHYADLMQSWGYAGRAQWDPGFFVYVAVALVGMMLWALIDPKKSVSTAEASISDELV
jgi:sugar phosphate permease